MIRIVDYVVIYVFLVGVFYKARASPYKHTRRDIS